MPEQLSNSNQTHARTGRAARAASLAFAAAVALLACQHGAPVSFAQNAAKAQAAPAPARGETVRQGKAKMKAAAQEKQDQQPAQERREKQPAPRPASEITRARRAAAPAATPSAAAPVATPSTAAPAATPASAVPPATPSASTAPATPPAARKRVPAAAAPSAAPVVAPAVDETKDAAAAPGSVAAKSKGEEGEVERLRAEIKDAKPGAERARLQRSLVEHLVALKRQPEALDALRLMIHEDRFDPPFFFNTGNALARLGDASAAEDAYRKAISQRRGNYSRALNNLGVILIRQGHWDEARETLAAALVQENYAYAEASYNLGRLHLLRGEADLAIREWLRTLRLEPEHAEAAAALARAYAEDGDAERGINVLDNFITRSTRTGAGVPREIAEARRELVAAATTAEDPDAAHSKTGNGAPDAQLPGASAKLRAHKVDRATYELLRSARAKRESGGEEAVKHYRDVLARSPGGYFPPANLELGAALMNLNRDEEAVAALLPLTQRDAARYPVAHYHLGRIFERQGHIERAAASFERAAQLYGDTNPQVLIDLSRARERAGDHAGALAAMNNYAAALGRQGTVPAWVAGRQEKLRRKAAAATTASPAPKDSSTPTRQ
ncbi:MAG TPA: tetratricopeptide repeat protein [Pyrinomonadaceae bacterium]|nr:tetratricopeptide repeat protein [Pyrinomonadaceae bacterium]